MVVADPFPCFADPSGVDTKDPTVVRFGGVFWMYYSQAPTAPGGNWDIGIARSRDLRRWEPVGTLNAGRAAESSQPGIAAPGAIVLDGRIELYYQTYPGSPAAIVGAWSDDGVRFTRFGTDAAPLLRADGAWNCRRAIDADVIQNGDDLLMYWATRDPQMERQMVGVSRAPVARRWDPAAWRGLSADGPILAPQVPTPLDAPGQDLAWEGDCIEAPAAIRHRGFIYLFYGGGFNNAPQQVGVAVSDDGVRFRRLYHGRPILPAGPPWSWNADESGHPFAFHDPKIGQDYLFYQGDNRVAGVRWRISVLQIEWQRAASPAEPDLPVLVPIKPG